eukprot:3570721-Pyramimonas_sp.AAC.1
MLQPKSPILRHGINRLNRKAATAGKLLQYEGVFDNDDVAADDDDDDADDDEDQDYDEDVDEDDQDEDQ